MITLVDRVIILPTPCKIVLEDLNSGHLGVNKVKSLARLICWWPKLNTDIQNTIRKCDKCLRKVLERPSHWTPWLLTCEAWQLIHITLLHFLIGTMHSKWPEFYFTNTANAAFTIKALRKTFSGEGVPTALVNDNLTHLEAQETSNWWRSVIYRHLITAPRYP